MGIGSLVLGIISIICLFIPAADIVGLVCGIIAVVLGSMARKDPNTAGLGTGGLVLGIIGIVLNLIWLVACGGWVSCMACFA